LDSICLWEKIINNLLGNAFKYTDGGGRIQLVVKSEGNKLLLQVTDDGQGIHPDDLPNIFDRYYQSSVYHHSLQGGTGIGLSLCTEYVRQFGGELSVTSTLGGGSTFSILFPPKIVPPMAVIGDLLPFMPNPTQTPILLAESNKKYTLLIVEDDVYMLNYLQSILADKFNLLNADHGQRALELLAQQPVDVIQSYLMMLSIDGLQVHDIVK
jgi:hypothetical protein